MSKKEDKRYAKYTKEVVAITQLAAEGDLDSLSIEQIRAMHWPTSALLGLLDAEIERRTGESDFAEATPLEPGRLNVSFVDRTWGGEWECVAGQADLPVGCERHPEHHFCETCQGFYGVPHDEIHVGREKHPQGCKYVNDCACRPCRIASGREQVKGA